MHRPIADLFQVTAMTTSATEALEEVRVTVLARRGQLGAEAGGLARDSHGEER